MEVLIRNNTALTFEEIGFIIDNRDAILNYLEKGDDSMYVDRDEETIGFRLSVLRQNTSIETWIFNPIAN